jgi:hypothetical protein
MKIIHDAFDNTDQDYMEASLKQRNPGPGSAGSTFNGYTTFEDLKFAQWEPANDPAIQAPAEGYKTDQFGGLLGIARLDGLPQGMKVVLQPAHGGKAKIAAGEYAGQNPAECAASLSSSQRMAVDFTTLIIGPDRSDPNKQVVWTFFPGPATFKFQEIPFQMLQEKYGTSEDQIVLTAAEAIELGYKFCKHVPGI